MINSIKSSNAFKCLEKSTQPIRCFIKKFLDDWSLSFAAMLAYYILISLIPMLIVVIGILGFLFKYKPSAENHLKTQIVESIFTDNSTKVNIQAVVDFAFKKLSKEADRVFSIGIVFAIFSASRLFVAIDKCMSIIYRLPERSWIRENLQAFGAVFVFLLIVPIIIGINSASSLLFNKSMTTRFAAFVVGVICSICTAFVFFEFIYWTIPNKKMSLKLTWCGSLFAACTLEVFIALFPLYIKYFMGSYTGQMGFAVIAILFCYYFATIMILGAQINAFFFENYQPLFDGLGTYISNMYQEYGTGDLKKPLIDENRDPKTYTN